MEKHAGPGLCGSTYRCSIRLGVERTASADDAVDLVPLGQEKLRQVRAILPGDARDERFLSFQRLNPFALPHDPNRQQRYPSSNPGERDSIASRRSGVPKNAELARMLLAGSASDSGPSSQLTTARPVGLPSLALRLTISLNFLASRKNEPTPPSRTRKSDVAPSPSPGASPLFLSTLNRPINRHLSRKQEIFRAFRRGKRRRAAQRGLPALCGEQRILPDGGVFFTYLWGPENHLLPARISLTFFTSWRNYTYGGSRRVPGHQCTFPPSLEYPNKPQVRLMQM